MQILHFNIRECEYYFLFMFITLWHVTLIGEVFFVIIIYYIHTKIYSKSSAIKNLMEFWNLTLVAKTTFGNYCKLGSSQSNKQKYSLL